MDKRIILATLVTLPIYMGIANAQASQGIVTADSLNVRSGPDKTYSYKFIVRKGDVLTIKNSENGWYEIITQDGKTGWASSKYINITESSEKKTMVVTASTLNLRSGPSTSYSVLKILKRGDEVNVLSTKDNWSEVEFNSYKGYVSNKYLADKLDSPVAAVKQYVTADSLNLRSGPSTTYSIITAIKEGEEVELISTEGNWSKVKYGSYTGYVSNKYLSDTKAEIVQTVKKYVIADSSLNMRTGPGTSYSVVTTIKRGQEVEEISTENGWSKVKYGIYTGYVSGKYLSDTKPDTVATTTKYVNIDLLNVRSGPSTSYKIIGSCKYGASVEVVSISDGWAKIKYNNSYAYVSNKYLVDKLPTTEDNKKLNFINTYQNLNYTFEDMLNAQYKISQEGYNVIRGNIASNPTPSDKYIAASREDLTKYLSPSSFTTNSAGKLQFLRLDKYRPGITAAELNAYLNRYCKSHSVFLNKGQAFIDAAKKYDIELTYFVAASMLETGYGVSELAQGVEVTTETGSKVKVYNFFGIAAYDGSAVTSASKYAYKMGWTTVDKTIEGSAKWLAANYIHSTKYDQNTLYKMRWQYKSGYQYASDITWPSYVGKMMDKLFTYYEDGTFEYLIPKYK